MTYYCYFQLTVDLSYYVLLNNILFNHNKSVYEMIGLHWNKSLSPMVLGTMDLL